MLPSLQPLGVGAGFGMEFFGVNQQSLFQLSDCFAPRRVFGLRGSRQPVGSNFPFRSIICNRFRAFRERPFICQGSRAIPMASRAGQSFLCTKVNLPEISLVTATSGWSPIRQTTWKMSSALGCPHQEPRIGSPTTNVEILGSLLSASKTRPDRFSSQRISEMLSVLFCL